MDNVYLHGKTLGVVGTGAIGGAMARLGRAIGMDVVAWTFQPDAGTRRRAAASATSRSTSSCGRPTSCRSTSG